MTAKQELSASTLLHDLAEAVFQVFDTVCTAVITEGHETPAYCVGDQQVCQRLVQHPAVRSALMDGLSRIEEPPNDGTMDDAVLIAIERLSLHPHEPAAVFAFATRDPAHIDRALALVHALVTETANQLMLLRQSPFLAQALAEAVCGVTIADATLEDTPLVYVNDAFTRMTGYTRAETLGRNCRFLQGHLRDQPGVHRIRDRLARGFDCTEILTNIRKDGEVFENRLRLRPIRALDGSVSHIIGIQDDVTTEQSALQSLDLQKRRYESLIDSMASYIWHMSPDGELQHSDPAWLVLAGLPPSSETPDTATIRSVLAPETSETFRQRWNEALQTNEPFDVVYQLPAASDSPRWFQDRIVPVRDDNDHLLEWFGVTQEITALKRAEQDRDRILQAVPTGMLVVARDGTITFANAHASRLFGYSAETLTGMTVEALIPEASRHRHAQLRSEYAANPSLRMAADRIVRALRQDGTEFDAEVGLSPFGGGHEWRVVAAINDTTELNNARKAVEEAAYRDHLTGLLSRQGFALKLDELRADDGLHPASMIVSIDISGLREINNAQGYATGDQVLQETARRLTAEVGESNLTARPGGSEFFVFVAVDRKNTPASWRRRLESAFDAPFEIDGFSLFISVVFGFSRIGTAARDTQALMNDAELALRQSQQDLSITWTRATRALERRTRATVTTTRELRLALERNELMLYYQPKVDLASACPVAAEALLRWQHPERGFISPADFITLAEQSQLIGPIGEWVLRRACRDLKAWQDAGLHVAPVSVNVSLVQFKLGSVPELVQKALTDFGIDPSCLSLEITESVFEEHNEVLKANLYTLNAMGVKLSLDDFGTGYSSLSYLKDYPFTEIKIDQSFISQLEDGAYGRAIVTAVRSMAEAIGAQVVAEGVETARQAELLEQLGCTLGQGFYYNRPLPEPQWRQLLSRAGDTAA